MSIKPVHLRLTQSKRLRKVAYTLLSFLIYILISIPARPVLGNEIVYFSIFPVFIASWELGARAGIAGSIFIILIEIFIHASNGLNLFAPGQFHTLVTGLLTLIGVTLAVKWVKNLREKTERTLEEQRKTEENLRQSEAKYRMLFDSMFDGIIIDQLIYDDAENLVDWIVVDVNPNYENFFHITREKAIGKRGSELYGDGEFFQEILQCYERAAKTGIPVRHETKIAPTGKDVRFTASALDRNNLAVVFTEITEQNLAIEAERKQRKTAEALVDIAAALTSSLQLDDVLDHILSHIRQVVSYDAVSIMLIQHGRLRVVRHHGYIERGLEAYITKFNRRVDEVPGLKWMADHHKPLVIPDTRLDKSWMVFPPTRWIHSYAGLPIQVRGELIGFLNFNSETPGAFQAEHIDRLLPFADQAALAIINARAFEDTERRAYRMTLINRIAHTLNQPIELNTILQVTIDSLIEALNLSQGALILLNETRNHMTIAADHPAPGTPSLMGLEISLKDNEAISYILQKKIWVLFENAAHDPRLASINDIVTARNVYSFLLVPIIVREEVIGAIHCDITEPGRHFTEEEIDLAQTITDLAAVRIEQARLFNEERKRSSELELLHEASLEITQHNDLPALLKIIVERAALLLDAPCGMLYLLDEQKEALVCKVSHNTTHNEAGLVVPFGQGAVGIVAQTREPLIVPDYASWPHRTSSLDQNGFLSVLSAPIVWQEKLIGVIQLARRTPHRPFTQRDINLLQLFSNHAAISLENSRLYNELQQIATQDPLTGLYNRRGLREMGQREIERARRFNRPLSALMLDVDHFKKFNDTYGHMVGDQVLVEIARICRQSLRSIDISCRYGGEEFVILLLENDIYSAWTAASRLCERIAQAPIATSAGYLSITASIGVATLDDSMAGLSDLVRAADEALYEAKHRGRNQAVMNTNHLKTHAPDHPQSA